MDAIILAGGLGTRLRSVVNDVPKCMAPVCGKPFLSFLFSYLAKYPEITNVILSVGHLRHVIMKWVDSLEDLPFGITYSVETEPLGTGGAVKKALGLAQSRDVLVLNGDTFFDVDLSGFIKEHYLFLSQLSLSLKPMNRFERYGNVKVNESCVVTAFDEKTYCEKGQINGGVYLIRKNSKCMEGLPDKFSLETDVLQQQVVNGAIHGFVHDGYFIDIGIPEDYEKANRELSFL